MTTVKEGASGINYDDVCPICGHNRGKYCQSKADLMLCPYQKECGNNGLHDYNGKDQYVRISCWGNLCGNIGMGPFLGSNILVATHGLTREGDESMSDFSKLIRHKFIKKIKKSNDEIIAAFKTNSQMSESKIENYSTRLDTEAQDINSKMKGKFLQKNGSHPLYTEPGSIQAHHLICSEAVKDDQWRALCKMTGYNINCKWNGVYIPSDMKLACHTELPYHKGGHTLGRSNLSQSYALAVQKKTDSIIDTICYNNDNELCKKNECTNILNQLKSLSSEILDYIVYFEWTIAADGLNYLPGGIGCANCSGITKKRKYLKDELKKKDEHDEYTYKNLRKYFRTKEVSITLKQIDSVEEMPEDHIGNFLDKVKCAKRKEIPKIKPEDLRLTKKNIAEKNAGNYHEEEFIAKYGNDKCKSVNDYKLEIAK